MDDEMLNLKQVCEFFGGTRKPLDKATIYRWIRKGKLPAGIALSPNRATRWRKSDCQKLLIELERAKV